MAVKGASNRYGNTKGSKGIGEPTKHINYAWAKDFNFKTLKQHFNDHGKSMGFKDKEQYKRHAIKFANKIDKKYCVSFIDNKTKATYKYNKKTNEFAIIKPNGCVVTYFKPRTGYAYYLEQKNKNKGV